MHKLKRNNELLVSFEQLYDVVELTGLLTGKKNSLSVTVQTARYSRKIVPKVINTKSLSVY